jgi:Flp pilus assembly pilin Flp
MRTETRQGQIIVEYVVMFTVIVAVILYASVSLVKPSLNRFFNSATKVIDNAATAIDAAYPG